MHYIICIVSYTLCYKHSVYFMHCILFILFYALCAMHCILCIELYSFYYMHCIIFHILYSIHFILCIIFHILYSMHCVLCIVLCESYSMHPELCIVIYELLLCILQGVFKNRVIWKSVWVSSSVFACLGRWLLSTIDI